MLRELAEMRGTNKRGIQISPLNFEHVIDKSLSTENNRVFEIYMARACVFRFRGKGKKTAFFLHFGPFLCLYHVEQQTAFTVKVGSEFPQMTERQIVLKPFYPQEAP